MPLNIGLDYDGTITSAPEIFLALAKSFKAAGHKVYIITMRYPSECEDIPDIWYEVTEGVYATSRTAKEAAMKVHDITIDIWIDDNPRAVNESAMQIWGKSSPEGVTVSGVHEMEN